ITVIGTASNAVIGTLQGANSWSAAVTPDGYRLLLVSTAPAYCAENHLQIVDAFVELLSTPRPAKIGGSNCSAWVTISPAGTRAYVGDDDFRCWANEVECLVHVIDLRTEEEIGTLHPGLVAPGVPFADWSAPAISFDGKRLLLINDHTLAIVDLATGVAKRF